MASATIEGSRVSHAVAQQSARLAVGAVTRCRYRTDDKAAPDGPPPAGSDPPRGGAERQRGADVPTVGRHVRRAACGPEAAGPWARERLHRTFGGASRRGTERSRPRTGRRPPSATSRCQAAWLGQRTSWVGGILVQGGCYVLLSHALHRERPRNPGHLPTRSGSVQVLETTWN